MDMPTVTAGHRQLEQLAGHWEGQETMHPSDWDPTGGTATGRTTSRVAVGGFALVSDYEQERNGAVTFTGHGVYTYDPEADRYTLYWVDSMGSPPEIFEGRFDGDVLTLAHGGPMHVRLTWNFVRPGHLASSMEMSPDGVTWSRLFDGAYRRS